MNQNISDDEARIRYKKAFIFFAVSGILFAIFVALQVSFPDTVMGNRWWRIIIFPSTFFGCLYSVSAACRVCTDLAYRGTRMRKGDDYTAVETWQHLPGREIADELVKKTLVRLGTMVYWKGMAYATVSTAIAVALPPGYGPGM